MEQRRVEQPLLSTHGEFPNREVICRRTIAADRTRWYALDMMRWKEQFRVARLFSNKSYRCIHETLHQLQEG
jgi:hypothetical protein